MRRPGLGIALSGLLVLAAAPPRAEAQTKELPLPGEVFAIDGRTAFAIEPPQAGRREGPMPWVWYAPTLKHLPGDAEKWMFARFLAAGIAIAGIDVGESYGSPQGRAGYQKLYEELTRSRGYSEKPVLLARSRGGLMLYNWAVEHPHSVGGIVGIYPVCNLVSYPGLARAAPAYGLTARELDSKIAEHNPIERLAPLAKAKVPILHIHGDADRTVPLAVNSAELGKRYKALGGPVEILVMKGRGHDLWSGWFQSQKLTDFAIERALARPRDASPAKTPSKSVPGKVKLPGLEIDFQKRCVDLEGTICLAQGLLELVACTRGSKEHESIVALDARPLHIHTALLMLGANPGHPAMRKPLDKGETRWIDVPPKGDAVDVSLVFEDRNGKMVEHPISDFVAPSGRDLDEPRAGEERRFPHTFLFAGSRLSARRSGPRVYLSDISGNVITIATFGDELLALPGIHDQGDRSLMWQVDPAELPGVGTRVTLRLRPKHRGG